MGVVTTVGAAAMIAAIGVTAPIIARVAGDVRCPAVEPASTSVKTSPAASMKASSASMASAMLRQRNLGHPGERKKRCESQGRSNNRGEFHFESLPSGSVNILEGQASFPGF